LTPISHYLSKFCKETNYDKKFVDILKKGAQCSEKCCEILKNYVI